MAAHGIAGAGPDDDNRGVLRALAWFDSGRAGSFGGAEGFRWAWTSTGPATSASSSPSAGPVASGSTEAGAPHPPHLTAGA